MRVLAHKAWAFSTLKPRPVKIIYAQGNNIHFNLAIEEYLFQTAKVQTPTLFLWRNSPTIVIGKHQNPWKECRVQEMKRDQVKLSRRKTGGGAVYQDLGNTCFSFLTPYEKDDKLQYRTVNNQIILDALKSLGVGAEVSGRNDLVVDGKKFSGSAYRLHLGGKDGTGKKSLHHGTIMFSVDFQALQKYLNPNKKKLESKGIDSVISRVVNLNEHYPSVNHQSFCKALQTSFSSFYSTSPPTPQTLTPDSLSSQPIIAQNFTRLQSWSWLYGECPYFRYTIQKKFQWGLIEITFQVENGKISQCRIYSDCLYPDFIGVLNQRIIGVAYDGEGLGALEERLKGEFGVGEGKFGGMAGDVCRWICQEM